MTELPVGTSAYITRLESHNRELHRRLCQRGRYIKAIQEHHLEELNRKRKSAPRENEAQKRTKLSPGGTFVSIGQIVFDTMMYFFQWYSQPCQVDSESFLMHLTEEDLSPAAPAEGVPEAPPGLSQTFGATFNIGDDPADKNNRRSSLEDTYSNTDWVTATPGGQAQDVKQDEDRHSVKPLSAEKLELMKLEHRRKMDLFKSAEDQRLRAAEKRRIAYDSPEAIASREQLRISLTVEQTTSPVEQNLAWCDSLKCSQIHTTLTKQGNEAVSTMTEDIARHPGKQSLDDEDHLRSVKQIAELVEARKKEARMQSLCGNFSNDNVCWKNTTGLGGGVDKRHLSKISSQLDGPELWEKRGASPTRTSKSAAEPGQSKVSPTKTSKDATNQNLFYDGTRLLPGTAIRIQGLISAPHFNGRTGNVSFRDEAKGKYQIKLDDGSIHTIAHEKLEVLSSYEDIIRLSAEDQKRPDNWNDENTDTVLTSEALAAAALGEPGSHSGEISPAQISKEEMIEKLGNDYEQPDAKNNRTVASTALSSGLARESTSSSSRQRKFLTKKLNDYPICQQTEVYEHLKEKGTYLPQKTVTFGKQLPKIEYPEEFTPGELKLVRSVFDMIKKYRIGTLCLSVVEQELSALIAVAMSEVPKTTFEYWVNNRIGGEVELREGSVSTNHRIRDSERRILWRTNKE